jgi:translation initiation factor IF-1
MVKNFGGKKTKGMARKNLTARPSNLLRLSTNNFEKYAQVSKTLGNAMCHVLCDDNITRLCHIRGKFKGRGKRDNLIKIGSWIMIGIREYESGGDNKKMKNCDLLEVYNDQDQEKLKQTVTTVNWRLFVTNLMTNETADESEEIAFMDEKEEEYSDLMNQQQNVPSVQKIAFKEEEEIDINDI